MTLHSKKLAVFSTKHNSTSKENIANVYGAKTILALIPLKLELELQPTAPSQVLADFHNNEITRSRQVTVLGHVSRPIHGDGRQTPDRQMFFVNSRPCGLPQIAKTFNEVYKSYNISQSPFVFANFKMDTNAYDVNVSPDKRIIMLHDQGRLLETLKGKLITLFEAQDQTVPLSQLPGQKLPAFKPLSVPREASNDSQDGLPSATVVGPRSFQEPSNADQTASVASSFLEASTVDSANSQHTNLISKFAARNTENAQQKNPSETSVKRHNGGFSRENQRLVRKLQMQNDRKSPDMDVFNDEEGRVDLAEGHYKEVREREQETEEGGEEGEQEIPCDRIGGFDDSEAATGATSGVMTKSGVSPDAMTHSPGPTRSACVQPDEINQTPIAEGSLSYEKSSDHSFVPKQPLRMTVDPPKSISKPVGVNHSSRASLQRSLDPNCALRKRVQPPSSHFAGSLRAFAAPGMRMDVDSNPADEIAGESASEAEDDGGPICSAESTIDRNFGDSAASDYEKFKKEKESRLDEESESDEEYLDEEAKKQREETRVQEIVRKAEESAAQPTQEQRKRNASSMKPSSGKDSTLNLVQFLEISAKAIEEKARLLHEEMQAFAQLQAQKCNIDEDQLISPKTSAEDRLSLTISKSDFAIMRIVGQFNLGFILAVRPAAQSSQAHDSDILYSQQRNATRTSDELFIIDQHASDEIHNFSRLSLTTSLNPQPLVRPHVLHLTAIEEETILAHKDHSLAKNGFTISVDQSGESPVGQRCSLLTLPTSRETIFNTRDLEELLALLAEVPAPPPSSPRLEEEKAEANLSLLNVKDTTVRPGRVRRMLAMRACRSSIMIGKSLSKNGMAGVVKRMGEIERPWNCPHGRPTMRHLTSLGELGGWSEEHVHARHGERDEEDEGIEIDEENRWVMNNGRVDWKKYVECHRDSEDDKDVADLEDDFGAGERASHTEYDGEAWGHSFVAIDGGDNSSHGSKDELGSACKEEAMGSNEDN